MEDMGLGPGSNRWLATRTHLEPWELTLMCPVNSLQLWHWKPSFHHRKDNENLVIVIVIVIAIVIVTVIVI